MDGVVDGLVRVPANIIGYEQFKELQRRLTLTNNIDNSTLEMWKILDDDATLALPRSCRDMFELEDKTLLGSHMTKGDSSFVPREGQEEAISQMKAHLIEKFGGCLIAPCGTGKTVMGAELALRLGWTTCVLVHKEFLATQWEDAFQMLTGGTLNEETKRWEGGWAKVGRMQRDQVDMGGDFDVVIAMAQSVTNPKRDYPDEFFDSFGMLICDEVHRYGADVWQTAITRFPATYRLGLTATYRRYDGMLPVIEHHIGGIGYEIEGGGLTPRVHIVKMQTNLDRKSYTMRWGHRAGEVNRGKLISLLAKMDARSEAIVKQIVRAAKTDRKILVLSERLNHLNFMAERVQVHGVDGENIGFYIGGKKQHQLDEAETKDLIFATYQMAKEGLDIPELDTLFLATPMVDVVQSVGRILRSNASKSEPVVVDFVDMGVGVCVGMGKARRRLYESLQYEVRG